MWTQEARAGVSPTVGLWGQLLGLEVGGTVGKAPAPCALGLASQNPSRPPPPGLAGEGPAVVSHPWTGAPSTFKPPQPSPTEKEPRM